MTHTQLCYQEAGCPPLESLQTTDAYCATCGQHTRQAVNQNDINNPTFSQHGDFLKGEWVCPACAFMYRQGKARPGNYLAIDGHGFNYLAISADSDKKSWSDMLGELVALPKQTKVTGVLTTDVKPRLFPRTQLATVGDFGLYIHAGDYDVSEYREFDLVECIQAIELINEALSLKFTKGSIASNLFDYFKIATKDFAVTQDLELRLSKIRNNPAFIPALIIARGA